MIYLNKKHKVITVIMSCLFSFIIGGLSVGFFMKNRTEEIMMMSNIQSIHWSYKTLMLLEKDEYQKAFELQKNRLQSSLCRLGIYCVNIDRYKYVRLASDWLFKHREISN